MSQLPSGTLAAKDFLESVIKKGISAAATAWLPGVAAIPVIGYLYLALVDWIVGKIITDPLLDQGLKYALAGKYVIDHKKFDSKFIKLSMLDEMGASPEEKENALIEAQDAMASFIRRGPLR